MARRDYVDDEPMSDPHRIGHRPVILFAQRDLVNSGSEDAEQPMVDPPRAVFAVTDGDDSTKPGVALV